MHAEYQPAPRELVVWLREEKLSRACPIHGQLKQNQKQHTCYLFFDAVLQEKTVYPEPRRLYVLRVAIDPRNNVKQRLGAAHLTERVRSSRSNNRFQLSTKLWALCLESLTHGNISRRPK